MGANYLKSIIELIEPALYKQNFIVEYGYSRYKRSGNWYCRKCFIEHYHVNPSLSHSSTIPTNFTVCKKCSIWLYYNCTDYKADLAFASQSQPSIKLHIYCKYMDNVKFWYGRDLTHLPLEVRSRVEIDYAYVVYTIARDLFPDTPWELMI